MRDGTMSNRQTLQSTDTPIDRHSNRQTLQSTDTPIDRHSNRQTLQSTDTPIDRHSNRQTLQSTDTPIDRHSNRQTLQSTHSNRQENNGQTPTIAPRHTCISRAFARSPLVTRLVTRHDTRGLYTPDGLGYPGFRRERKDLLADGWILFR
ncbi:uncharacterized protein EKO05_0011243 [Ascochyta rabiei]|uniref:uncharacterized protein n=1 Tax=Didymella rabiei TaxID=5454 RepID=UPI002208FACF|nr:uncharacterized protein EKO05_0011243 [Ascochyta rabiei]UPX21037.1 hypothetical protein EKO05_0011243 [Ascochyta rabiei]